MVIENLTNKSKDMALEADKPKKECQHPTHTQYGAHDKVVTSISNGKPSQSGFLHKGTIPNPIN